MIPMKENQASALTIVADRPTKRKNRYACKIACIAEFFYQNWAIGQKVLMKIAIHIDNSMSVAI